MTGDRLARNNAYYERFADEVGDRTEARDYSRALRTFTGLVPKGRIVLDLGCGTGHHMVALRELGYQVVGVDPSERMRRLSSEKGFQTIDGSFETLPQLELPSIHGVWCAASLLHVPEEALIPALSAVRARLPEGGALFVTVRLGSGASWDAWDDPEGDAQRFIQLYTQQELLSALEATSFQVAQYWCETSSWGRPSEWVSIVAAAS